MSKYLNVPNGNYKVSVQTGGTIYLDTGLDSGTVEISGDLVIRGDTTTVNTTQMVIEDRVITLNNGDDAAAGIQGTDNFAGIEINRGSLPDAYFGYDEDVTGFIAYTGSGTALSSIATNKIANKPIQAIHLYFFIQPEIKLAAIAINTIDKIKPKISR